MPLVHVSAARPAFDTIAKACSSIRMQTPCHGLLRASDCPGNLDGHFALHMSFIESRERCASGDTRLGESFTHLNFARRDDPIVLQIIWRMGDETSISTRQVCTSLYINL
ncbi:hypothetical protein E2553_31260 [Paraburkholderia dipogonis]|uniref:Uncharacterized protein n=1 Tax=Paraburkholderia dipogonis TaxID=1211383 RepID=A0A4Y8MUZ6_9BURK|nr:hypothetical protein [Paraburkholderia dipogonis]TFE41165.1 hypothetical protein E2553_31260 [Paraburkholderia dipogonis]